MEFCSVGEEDKIIKESVHKNGSTMPNDWSGVVNNKTWKNLKKGLYYNVELIIIVFLFKVYYTLIIKHKCY